jgi:hypothetical protein
MREIMYPTAWGWGPDEPWRARPEELGPLPGRRTSEPLAMLVAGLAAVLQQRTESVFELLLDSAPATTTACLFTAAWIQAAGDEVELRLNQLHCLWALIDDCQQIAWRAQHEEIDPSEAFNALAWARDVLAVQRQEFAWLEGPALARAAAEVALG